MAALNPDCKVLIIGAGPGGLVLAQILRGHGIAYDLFERDEAISGRAQGWAIALIESLVDLDKLLPKDIGDIASTSVNHGPPHPSPDTILLLNALSGGHIAQLGGVSKGSPGYLLRVGRERLRHFLSHKLNISYGKKFTHCIEDSTGVTAFFSDGSSTRGSILVGSDGAHSAVRKWLLPSSPLLPSTIVPIVGEVTLPYSLYVPYHSRGSAAIISTARNLRYMIGLRSINPDRKQADYYWALCFHSSTPEVDADWVATANKQQMFDRAIELTNGLDHFFTDIIRYTGVQGMKTPPLRFREFVPPEQFPDGKNAKAISSGSAGGRRVTLMGDAAHSMIPFCVAGANTALQDACDLARGIEDGIRERKEVGAVLKEYEDVMLPRGRKMVLASHHVGETGDLRNLVDGKGRLDTMSTSDMGPEPSRGVGHGDEERDHSA